MNHNPNQNIQKKQIALAFVFLVLTHVAFTNQTWIWVGPPGGTVQQIVPDRRNPKVWYLNNNGRLYRSMDSGRNWSLLANRNDRSIVSIHVHPKSSNVWLTASRQNFSHVNELLYSSDNGSTFISIPLKFTLNKLILDPDNPQVLYATGLGFYDLARSENGGRTWKNFKGYPFPPTKISGTQECILGGVGFQDLYIDHDTLYASGSVGYNCYRGEIEFSFTIISVDRGETWKTFDERAFRFHTDPAFPDRVFAFTPWEIFTFNSRGVKLLASFTKDRSGIRELVSGPRVPERLFVLFQPYDGRAEVIRSNDEGKSWKTIPINFQNSIVDLESADDIHHGLFGGTDGAGLLYRNGDSGWIPVGRGIQEANYSQIVGIGKSSYLYLLAQNNLFGNPHFLFRKDPDSSNKWKNVTPTVNVFGCCGGTVILNPANSNHLILTGGGGNTVLSYDGGITWIKSIISSSIKGFYTGIFHPIRRNVVYAANRNILFRSDNGGRSFHELSFHEYLDSEGIKKIVADPVSEKTLYFVSDFEGIFKTTDSGKTLSRVSTGIIPVCGGCRRVVLDLISLGLKDSYLALAEQDREGLILYRTDNAGQNWTVIARRLRGIKIYVADSTGQHLFLTGLSGLYESTDGGKSWINVFGNDKSLQVWNMTDARLGPIYLSTNRGVLKGL